MWQQCIECKSTHEERHLLPQTVHGRRLRRTERGKELCKKAAVHKGSRQTNSSGRSEKDEERIWNESASESGSTVWQRRMMTKSPYDQVQQDPIVHHPELPRRLRRGVREPSFRRPHGNIFRQASHWTCGQFGAVGMPQICLEFGHMRTDVAWFAVDTHSKRKNSSKELAAILWRRNVRRRQLRLRDLRAVCQRQLEQEGV